MEGVHWLQWVLDYGPREGQVSVWKSLHATNGSKSLLNLNQHIGSLLLAFLKPQSRITTLGPGICNINHVTVRTGTVAELEQFLLHQWLTSMVRSHTLATSLSLGPSSVKHSSRNLNWLPMFNQLKQSWTPQFCNYWTEPSLSSYFPTTN